MAKKKRTYEEYIEILVHRVLARHRPYERCSECPR